VPWSRMRRLKLETGRTRIRVLVAPTGERPVIELVSGEGAVLVDASGQSVSATPAGDPRIEGAPPVAGAGKEAAFFRVELEEGFRGTLGWEPRERP